MIEGGGGAIVLIGLVTIAAIVIGALAILVGVWVWDWAQRRST